mgnify:CR=1 FL=1
MTSRKRLIFSYCCLSLLLAMLFAVSLFWGSVALTPQAVLAALTGRGQDALSVGIITQLRLPRAVMAVLLGAALSAAGYLLQTFFANPIAGPFVMGISSGAKLAVALVMVLFLNYGLLTSSAVLILAAFAGAMAAMAFVLAAARRVQRMSILVICGVMIGYICSAITEFVVAFAQDSSIVNLHNWSQGSFSGMTWGNVRTAALVVLPALAAAFCLAKPMAAYQMGEAYARSVGVDVRRFSRLLQPPVRPFLLRIALRNLLGNIVLFIPLGYFLPAISASLRKFYLTFLSVTIIITTVELAQLVFMVGTCDIDDLILNLLGASMGYGLYRLTNRG